MLDPISTLTTVDNTEQLLTIIQYISNKQELMKELIFWNKAISFSQILILVAVLFTILSSNLKGSGKR